jgi:hypothetical protein
MLGAGRHGPTPFMAPSVWGTTTLAAYAGGRPVTPSLGAHLWVHTFETIEDLRQGLQDFVARYNATWLVARHGYRTPDQVRADQRRVDRPNMANLPLAA